MSECTTQSEYDNDTRIACKYGTNCYQKNTFHRQKYKHLPKVSAKDDEVKHKNKKLKLDSNDNSSTKGECSSDVQNENVIDSNSTTTEQADTENENDHAQSRVRNDSVEVQEQTNSVHLGSRSDVSEVQKKPDTSPKKVFPSSPNLSDEDFIKEAFLVKMPKDFYSFWELCVKLKPDDPLKAFKDCQLLLVGPFDVLAKKFKNCNKDRDEFLRHWRYYYDPPEFQTVIKGDDKTGYHIGYFRDSPNDEPVFVGSNNCGLDDCEIHQLAENIFGGLNIYLESYKKKCDPFKKLQVSKLRTKLVDWAEENSFTLDQKTTKMKNRNTKVVTKTFHKAGIVVPFNRKTQLGYRVLIETDTAIKKILKCITDAKDEDERNTFMSNLQPVITMASIAVDECDFGTGIELGLDLFANGNEIFHPIVLSMLTSAYNLLDRNAFSEIIQAHLKDRRRGSNLSILD